MSNLPGTRRPVHKGDKSTHGLCSHRAYSIEQIEKYSHKKYLIQDHDKAEKEEQDLTILENNEGLGT